jgi:hypothetical protein
VPASSGDRENAARYPLRRARLSLFLEESIVCRPHGRAETEVQALFRYDLDAAGEKSESSLVMICPAKSTDDAILAQLEQAADRLAAILEKGSPVSKTYNWNIG